MLGYAGWYSKDGYRDFLFFVPFQQLFLLGPVIYFYTRSLLDKSFVLTRKDFFHFVPAALYFIYILIVFVVDALILDEYYFYADGRDMDLDFWYQMSGLISMLCYLILSINYYRRYRKLIVQEVSYAESVTYRWLNHFLIVFGLLLLLRVCFFITNPEWGQFGSKYWYYLCFSFLFYYIAISGYSNTIRATIAIDGLIDKSTYDKEVPIVAESNEGSISDHEVTDDLDVEYWKAQLLSLMEKDKVYTNPELTLSDLANTLGTNRSVLSRIINQGFDMNFNDFINSKRVEEVIQKMINGQHQHNTLLAMALESGFNSKTTFNRAFKKYTALTPRQYLVENKL